MVYMVGSRVSTCVMAAAILLSLVADVGAFSSAFTSPGLHSLSSHQNRAISIMRPAGVTRSWLRGPRMASTLDTSKWTRPAARGKMDTVIGAKAASTQPVAPKHDEGCNLGAYMALPTDQYALIPLPNGAKLEKLDEEHFALRVPELQIFNVWLRPYVVATVQVNKDGVTIEAQEAKLEGSPEVERLDLNSKTAFSIKVELKGVEDPRGLRSKLWAQSEVNVWVDPPQIFRVMFPKQLIYETGNSVLKTSLTMLQTTFLQGLARDYERWATDAKYREARRKK